MTPTTSELIHTLFLAFSSGATQQKAEVYINALEHLHPDRLGRAIDHLMRHHDRASPPSISKILDLALGAKAREKAEGEGKLDSEIRGLLPRLSSVDYWPFTKSYGGGVEPNQALYQRLGVSVPPAMDFEAIPSPEASAEAHREAAAAMSARVRELYGKTRVAR